MGFFDFLKSPKEKKGDPLMEKINLAIFPNGNPQIDKEIQEVRALLDFRYTKEEITKTYIHAAALFYVAKDKGVDRITQSILSKEQSCVTKADAVRLHGYLMKKFGIPLQQNLTTMSNNLSDGEKLFMAAKGGIVELKREYQELSDMGKFEVILFNSVVALAAYKEKHPSKYDKTEEVFFVALFEQARNYKFNLPPDTIFNLINSRFAFYSNEIDKMYSSQGYLPSRIYTAFYVTPLTQIPEPSLELLEVAKFQRGLATMFKWVYDSASVKF